jgi:hypothetical protein
MLAHCDLEYSAPGSIGFINLVFGPSAVVPGMLDIASLTAMEVGQR